MSITIIFKGVAALLLTGSGYFFGKSMDKKLKDRTDTLKNLTESIIYLKSKIYQESYTLPEAMSATSAKFCNYPESVYERTAYFMVSEGMDGQQAWNKACECCAENRILGTEGTELLKTAGGLMGCGDREMQKENLDVFAESLKKACANAEAKEEKDGKLYIKLGLAAGCIAAIVLW